MKASEETGTQHPSGLPAQKIQPGDPRYADLVQKGFNKRFTSRPDYVCLVGSTAQVVQSVQEAVRNDLRVVARSGGHCLEGFVSDPAVRVVIDMSLMTQVSYDPTMSAFAVEAGATLGEAYRRLFLGWGVTIPAGESPDIGVGGHVLGGAFGFLCRQHGLAVDHLYAVEVVVVDERGEARSVIATREADDPQRDLWWAHTGGGGGNFGVVTRYWFRSPGAAGEPSLLLPKAPVEVVTLKAEWDWSQVNERDFRTVLRNYEDWCEHNSAHDSPSAALSNALVVGRPPHGRPTLRIVAIAGADSERLIDENLRAVAAGVGVAPARTTNRSSWLTFVLNPFPDLFAIGPGGVAASQARLKLKDAFLRKPHSDRQLGVAFDYMTRKHPQVIGGSLGLASYGGKVNTVAPQETASAQREAILTTSYGVGWAKPGEEAASLTWVREFYRDMFADSGGVPVPGGASDGALINHPDVDLADPEWNRSGVPWSTLYYKDNYPRLQRVKAQWDPRNVFRHALSIRT